MLWLWILGGLAAVLTALCLLRLGILAQIDETGGGTVRLRIGWIHVQIWPKPQKVKKRTSDARPAKKKKERKTRGSLPKLTFADVQSLLSALWPPLSRALGRTRRAIRVEPAQAFWIFAGEPNPARAAQWYGYANAVVWTALPAFEQMVHIENPSVHIGMDFNAKKDKIGGKLGVSVRVGTLLVIGASLMFPALRWYLQFRKRTPQSGADAPQQDTPAASAA